MSGCLRLIREKPAVAKNDEKKVEEQMRNRRLIHITAD